MGPKSFKLSNFLISICIFSH